MRWSDVPMDTILPAKQVAEIANREDWQKKMPRLHIVRLIWDVLKDLPDVVLEHRHHKISTQTSQKPTNGDANSNNDDDNMMSYVQPSNS